MLAETQAMPPVTAIQLVDASADAGIEFLHTDGDSGEQYLFELMTAGLALFDYDGDDLLDIYLLNGAPQQGAGGEKRPVNALYHNNGDWTFTDVTVQAGVGDIGQGLGVAVADYDNDGAPDLYVSNFGPNVLYHNNGDGSFTDITAESLVGCGNLFSAGVAFLDFDNDGALDLYVAQYISFSQERHTQVAAKSYPYPPTPRDYEPVPDVLFRNEGDGRFTDVSESSGISSVAGPSMGIICFDHDVDGDTDVVVCNDGTANFLFQNDGLGRFKEVGLLSGTAFNFRGDANGSMGIDCGDYDNDGRMDLFITGYTGELPVLYRNLGAGAFQDVTHVTGAGTAVFPHTNWGTGLVDFDNDGDRDLFIANGHFLKNVRAIEDRTDYRLRNTLLMNKGQAFVDVSKHAGNGLEVLESSRGAGFDDLDNDGKTDIVVLNANARPTIMRNESVTTQGWIQLELCGTASNRDGVGAKVRVVCGDFVQVCEQHSGRGYQSHYGTRLQFGLGNESNVDQVGILWPSGKEEVFRDILRNQRQTLTEGTGRPVAVGGLNSR
ncbi:MAG: CRTAC1 family protein [Planctomycetia bacterium]|nr:CRTAC1 family protein [Planctomycetia bacterium]